MKKAVSLTLVAVLLLSGITYAQEPSKPVKRPKRATYNPREGIQRAIVLEHFGSYLQAPPDFGEVEMFLFEMDRSNSYYYGDPSEGGGGEYEPFGDTEKCQQAKAETNVLLMQMGLAYAETLVSCGAVFVPWLGGISITACLFVSAGTMALAYAVVNAAKKQRLECRGY